MGLLDDAIREHLELKRLHGADPGMVTREEREAFGSARGGEVVGMDDDAHTQADLAVEDAARPDDDPTPGSRPDQPQEFSNVGQETAELDMRTVLDNESGHEAAPVGPVAVGPVGAGPPTGRTPPEQGAAGDPLDWEMPGSAPRDSDEPLEDDPHGGDPADRHDEPVEDVLEETPEFLRDTPEQERLWFEQRPPRDFEFDK
jgi:hypothetical protein